jgi:tRNA 2-thiouridine synthesizing protein A
MNNSEIIDARGLSCPQPVLLTAQAMKKSSDGTIEVLVDSSTALDNVSRHGRNSGWAVTVQPGPDGSTRVLLKR